MGAAGALGGWFVVSEVLNTRARARQEKAWAEEGLPPELRTGGDGKE